MADTEFSGDLMGLESVVFNPHYSQKTSFVTEDVFPVPSDKGLVDYLVHGKHTMTQTYDATIGDLPYVEKESKLNEHNDLHFIPNPKWYSRGKWNKMQVALRHSAPACCSIPYRPEYKIIHTAPTHSKEIIQSPSTPTPTGLDIPDSMTEAVPYTVKKVTSKVVYERDDSRDNMDYDEAYASVTGKVLSPFFGLKGMDLINAKLDFIGGSEDEEEEDAEEYDSLYGVDCIDESDAEIKHAQTMQVYTQRLLAAAQRVDKFHEEHKLSGSALSWSYKMTRAMTSSGMMEGVDALNEYKATPGAFVFNEFEKSHCPEHYTVDEMDEDAIHSIYNHDPTVIDGIGRNHYRAGHWISGDVVETRAPEGVQVNNGPSVLNLVKPQPIRKGANSKISIAKVVAIEDEVVFFGLPDMMTEKLYNTGMGMIINPKRSVKMSADVETILSVLTSEPKFLKEIGELVGMSETKVGKILKTATKAGLVKVVTVKNKDTEFRPRASYYI